MTTILLLLLALLIISWISSTVNDLPANRPSVIYVRKDERNKDEKEEEKVETPKHHAKPESLSQEGFSADDSGSLMGGLGTMLKIVIFGGLFLILGGLAFAPEFRHKALKAWNEFGFETSSSTSIECAGYTKTTLVYNKAVPFSPQVVSSKDAIKEDPSNPMGYQQPPCGANLVDIGRHQISYLCTINCQGNPDVEGKVLHFQFFFKNNQHGGAIERLPNGSRVDWVVRHGARPPSIPAGADYFIAWFVTNTPLTGTLRMEARL